MSEEITLHPKPDLTLTLITPESYSAEASTTKFHVSKPLLISSSDYFRAMLTRNWTESSSANITLHDDPPKAMEIWLRLFHSALDDSSFPPTQAWISDIWAVIVVADKYGFEVPELNSWFVEWYQANWRRVLSDTEYCRQMLFPCIAFDYAEGFAAVSKELAYNMQKYITELRPEGTVKGLSGREGKKFGMEGDAIRMFLFPPLYFFPSFVPAFLMAILPTVDKVLTM